MRLPRGLLIYCRADTAPERVITVVGGNQQLHTHPVDLGGTPSSVAQALDTLAQSIRQLAAIEAARPASEHQTVRSHPRFGMTD
jgi:5-methylcytosine-specific restriction enzyme subunit McrC